MMKKIWHKFFLLAVLSFMPVLSHAVGCLASFGPSVVQEPKTTPFPGGWRVTAQYSLPIVQDNCFVMPVQIFQGDPTLITRNGVTVNIQEAKIFLRNAPSCFNSDQGKNTQQYKCSPLPQNAVVEVQYTLTGKSTATTPGIPFFNVILAIVPGGSNTGGPWGTQMLPVNVPASTAPPAPTCKRATMTRATWR